MVCTVCGAPYLASPHRMSPCAPTAQLPKAGNMVLVKTKKKAKPLCGFSPLGDYGIRLT